MDRYCFIFPGQGSQYVGMGKDLYDSFNRAKELYEHAEDILKINIKKLSFEGPAEDLQKTLFTQPAILVHSIVCFEILQGKGVSPQLACGHSLGEYSTLYSAGVLSFESVLKLVKKRGELMFQEGEKKPGAMAAVIGLSDEIVIDLCKNVKGVVVPANYNAPGQVVISGEPNAVKLVCDMASAKGALKTIMLAVSGAFHSPLLQESAENFKEYLKSFEFNPPKFPIIPNRTGIATDNTDEIRSALEEQLINPVLWTKSILSAKNLGFTTFVEVGPGRVLSGLVKRIDKSLKTINAGCVEDINSFKVA
ncbi:MAG: ACP S-malonyltransferase [candidate division WOR-3 bacterium]